MSVDQAARPPAYEVLAEDLRSQITTGALRPGQRLPTETQLCERSGVSRSTVREALRLLASQHLIVTMRGVSGGSFVAHPSPTKIADTLAIGVGLLLSAATVGAPDLIEVREALEVPATGLAAQRRTEPQLDAIRRATFDPAHDDVGTMLRVHQEFHLAVVAATGNELYGLISQPLYSVIDEVRLSGQLPDGFWTRVHAEHRTIQAAIAARDSTAARTAAREHLANLRFSCPLSGPGSALQGSAVHRAALGQPDGCPIR